MYLYVELWNAKPAWSALSTEERVGFVDRLGSGVQSLVDQGVELVGFAINEDDTPHRGPYTYMAIWRMPNKGLIDAFEQAVEQLGWHKLFDQVNARGEWTSPQDAFAKMIQA